MIQPIQPAPAINPRKCTTITQSLASPNPMSHPGTGNRLGPHRSRELRRSERGSVVRRFHGIGVLSLGIW
jgi:hypothetical protein